MAITARHRVHFFDTDAMMVVHHANYIRWFEVGRVEYLRSIGITLDEMMADGFLFPITEVKAKYHAPGHFDDDVLIITKATALTKAKMVFEYQIVRERDGELLVSGRSQNVFTLKDTGQITRLPEKYYSLLKAAMEKEDKEVAA